MFVALETSREIAVVDAHGAYELFRINVGRAPQGLVVSPDGSTLFVNNFMDRTVGIYDLGDLQDDGPVDRAAAGDGRRPSPSEKLSREVLLASSSSTTPATRASRATGT